MLCLMEGEIVCVAEKVLHCGQHCVKVEQATSVADVSSKHCQQGQCARPFIIPMHH